jgi:UDP-glucose 4-epimerase
VLVTGGAGYIGSVVTAMLLEAGHQVSVVDSLLTGHADSVPEGARFVRADLLDRATVMDGMSSGFDAVVHLAALSLVAESTRAPETYFRTNLGVTLNLLEAMRAHRVPRMVFSSTAAVYGEPETLPITEDTLPAPANPYGASKLAVDHLLGFASAAHGLNTVSLRYFNVAGAYGRFGERHATETHLIPRILDVAAGRSPAVDVYGTDYPTPDGTAVRDYVHVQDLARVHLLALERAPAGHRVYNIGSGEGFSVRQVIDVARAVTGHEIPTVARPRRDGDPARLVASGARARQELGYEPQKPQLETIVEDAWAWMGERAQS